MSEPTKDEFLRGIEEFEKHEKRDAMYKVAKFLVSHFWSDSSEMANGLGVLLFIWNQAFYRYGPFDFDKLERCIADNIPKLSDFRKRDILNLSEDDEERVKDLFVKFLRALQIESGKKKGERSPVAVSKALHLLAPNFFPLWDARIARAYRCQYTEKPAERYLSFCRIMKTIADRVRAYAPQSDKTLLKLIDEHNYSKYTKGWI